LFIQSYSFSSNALNFPVVAKISLVQELCILRAISLQYDTASLCDLNTMIFSLLYKFTEFSEFTGLPKIKKKTYRFAEKNMAVN
jgi:hypothetical protein